MNASLLPVHAALPGLLAALRQQRNVVLEAPPGAGKSTVVPLALLDQPWAQGRRILLLEPRRLAARAVAARMAQTLAEPIGQTVGYRMRLDTRVGPRTRLEVVTEGVLTRMLQEDPALEGVAAVLFDEFHERSLAADLGLALCLEAQAALSPELRLLVMSATLDGAAIAALLGDAPVIRTEGRQHAVQVRYTGRGLPPLPAAGVPLVRHYEPVATVLRRAVDETTGDLLVFLPGAGDIRCLRSVLENGSRWPDVIIHELFGELALEAQEAALAPAPAGRRKLVLATNVAETSLTIAGVTVVVDVGLVRRSVFDPGTGMSRLVTERVSRASATQRAGRAGRTAPGVCYRLWGEGSQPTLAAFTPPEILSADLAPLALELAQWGTRDVHTLRWLDVPPAAALQQARDLLRQLDALDEQDCISAHGKQLCTVGLHPRLAHMLIRARAAGLGQFAARLAAVLSERDLLRSTRDPDLRSRLEALRGSAASVDRGAIERVRRLQSQLAGRSADARAGDDNEAGAVLAWAFPDRIAQRRPGSDSSGTARYLLSNGRGAVLEHASTLGSAAYLVAIDLDDAEAAAARIRLAAPVTLLDLQRVLATQLREQLQSGFDEREQSVSARRQQRLGALVLGEKMVVLAADEARQALVQALRERGLGALPWDEASRALLARLRFAATGAGPTLPPFDEQALLSGLEDWLGEQLQGITRLSQMTRVRLSDALLARLDYRQQRQLDERAPTHWQAPTGTRVRIDYEDESAPCVEVRLQEVFGLADTPRIAGGTVPVTFKLLSPARRPVQITRDLAGFWRGSYAEVRKELRGRYPRHYWPDDPLQAEPQRGPRRPRS